MARHAHSATHRNATGLTVRRAQPLLRVRYHVLPRKPLRTRPLRTRAAAAPAHPAGAQSIPGVHPIRSLPLPPDEVASAETAPLPASPNPPVLTAVATAPPLRRVVYAETASTTAPSVAAPASTPAPKPIHLSEAPAVPADPAHAAANVTAPARRLLTPAHDAAPTPAPYMLPNHVLPLDLELQIANSINTGGKGPLTSDAAHNFHLSASAAGVITTTLNNPPSHQSTDNAAGALVSFGKRSANWFDFSLNYQFSRFTESYVSLNQTSLATIPVSFQEISAEYLHTWWDDGLSTHRIRPFVGLGGGALLFTPNNTATQFATQTRAAGLVDLGADIPLRGERVSLRIQSHTLAYKAPDFNSNALSGNRWVVSTEPAVGLNFRF